MPDGTMANVTTPRGAWALAGVIAGLTGLAVSHAVTMAMTLRSTPLVGIAELVVGWIPGILAEQAHKIFGSADRAALLVVILVALLVLMAVVGHLAAEAWWKPVVVQAAVGAALGYAALAAGDARAVDLVPVLAGIVTWIVLQSFLSEPLRDGPDEDEGVPEPALPADDELPATVDLPGAAPPPSLRALLGEGSRRTFLVRGGTAGIVALGLGFFGGRFGHERRITERARRLLKLPLSDPRPPRYVRTGLEGMPPWQTPIRDFYQVNSSSTVVPPAIRPSEWRLRIHGMVETQLVLSYEELVERELTEAWITLSGVTNPVGGTEIGNAWWSGVRVAEVLAEAGVSPEADAVLQTAHDGWTCVTPLSALTDGRNALLAIGMNGQPLPVDHGFPVRMIVPGLYGFVSATKWLVDLEVTRFSEVESFAASRGWAERGPVKLGSRIDVPEDGADVPVGLVQVGGSAWHQHTGVAGVEFALDGGEWQAAEIARTPNRDTWVQWTTTIEVAEGEHTLLVRAIGEDGEVQTGIQTEPKPDGATGWHQVGFEAS